MIIYFGQNKNNGIPVNPSRTIRSIMPHIISMKCESDGIYISGRIYVMESQQETSGDLSFLNKEHWISLTGSPHGMVQQKVNVKTVETSEFSKMLNERIILKLKKLSAKIL